jgi:hypothetical protein
MNESTVRNKIAAIVEVLVDREVASRGSILGCDPNEIAEIESHIGHKLPFAYREFLMQMGRGAGRFYEGTDMFYPCIVDMNLTQAGRELLAEDKSAITLPSDGLVFSMHQGYQFLFIRANGGIDPPVYYYMEGSGKLEKKADTLSEFLVNAARDEW